ncbi:MAG: hypothetical protein JWN25_474 [Verrucomicrobiales bacterium]|jgi:hypothetical protein|nr:hypothetical protein [Verrucomicrobiales bacterium]
MQLPQQPVTLTPAQVEELNRKLSQMRHDVNNTLSLIVAAIELIKYKPEMTERMIATLKEQPPKIISEISKFSQEFEVSFGIVREPAIGKVGA